MTPGLVSVVIPTHNGERYLALTVASAIAQTYRPMEIIVVNDGSTDSSANVLATFSDQIKVITQANQGYVAARRRGVMESSGEFIAFLDHDDLWLPEKIARQIDVFRADPSAVMVFTARDCIDGEGKPTRQIPYHPREGHCLVALTEEDFVTASSMLVPRRVLTEQMLTGGPEWTADWDLVLQVAEKGPIRLIPEPLTKYRVHQGTMSGQTRAMAEGSRQTLDRLVARVQDPAVHAAAARHWHWNEIELAHAMYDEGNYPEARRIFREAGSPRRLKDWTRYISSALPAGVRRPLRRAYQKLRRDS